MRARVLVLVAGFGLLLVLVGRIHQNLFELGYPSPQSAHLQDAAATGDDARVRQLLRAAPPRDRALHDALFLAVAGGHGNVARRLLAYGADPNHVYWSGRVSPLRMRLDRRHRARTAEERLALGGWHQVDSGFTPLMAASASGREDLALLLLRAGADPARANERGVTPLMVAADHGRERLVRLFLGSGAPRDVRDNDNRRAADYAWYAGRTELALALGVELVRRPSPSARTKPRSVE